MEIFALLFILLDLVLIAVVFKKVLNAPNKKEDDVQTDDEKTPAKVNVPHQPVVPPPAKTPSHVYTPVLDSPQPVVTPPAPPKRPSHVYTPVHDSPQPVVTPPAPPKSPSHVYTPVLDSTPPVVNEPSAVYSPEDLDSIEDVGAFGEELMVKELKRVVASGRSGKILKNVYVPFRNGDIAHGNTTEIDVLFLTKQGVFVLESKYCSGSITGDENQNDWYQILPEIKPRPFYNPLLQNQTHVSVLREYISAEIPIIPIVVFTNVNVEQIKLKIRDPDSVVLITQLEKTILKKMKANGVVISDNRLSELYNTLEPFANVAESVKRAHQDRIHREHSR